MVECSRRLNATSYPACCFASHAGLITSMHMADRCLPSCSPASTSLHTNRQSLALAPPNYYFEGPAHESFRRFLLEPENQRLFQRLLEFHVVPRRLTAAKWSSIMVVFKMSSSDFLHFWTVGNKMKVGLITVMVLMPLSYDGVVYSVDDILVPKIVQQAFREWKKKRFNSFG